MKCVRTASCELFSGGVVVWRIRFSFCVRVFYFLPVSAHTLAPVDMSQNKGSRSLSFSTLYGHGAQLFIDLLEQRDEGVPTGQGDPHLAHRDADQRADLQ